MYGLLPGAWNPCHIDVLKHAVDRLAKNWRKDIKLLDTKLTVSRGAYSDIYEWSRVQPSITPCVTKRVDKSHSATRNTTSCNRIKEISQAQRYKLITLQILFQILYCRKYKHDRLKKPIKFLNEPNSTNLIAKSGIKPH